MEQHQQSRVLQRRVATAPTLLQRLPRIPPPVEQREKEVDTIFCHTNAKVISLVALSDQTFSLDSSNRDTIGPWQSHFERTIAIGLLRLYRAPGSVAFLSCGSALQPIFPKSQCWSMEDDGSKFILQIRPPSYWRIELGPPNQPSNPSERIEAGDTSLSSCLESVLLLDKTPCPFKESVPISLPPETLSVKKRRPWKPLRSYPSEPILPREPRDTCHDGQSPSEALNAVVPASNTISEGNTRGEALQEEDKSAGPTTCKASETTHQTSARELADQEGSLHKTSLQAVCTKADESAFQPTSYHEQTSSYLPWNSSTSAYTKQAAAVPLLDAEKDPLDKSTAINVEEKKEMRRRYTIASSWLDAELEASTQTSNDAFSNEAGQTHETQSRNEAIETAALHRTSSPENYCHSHPHSVRGHGEPGLRQRHKAHSDTQLETERHGRRSTRTDTNQRPESTHPDILSKTIYLLFYAVFGILVLSLYALGSTIRKRWKPEDKNERPQRLDVYNQDSE